MRVLSGLLVAICLANAHPAQAWAPQRLGVSEETLLSHLENGWPIEQAHYSFCIHVDIDREGRVLPGTKLSSRWAGDRPPPPPEPTTQDIWRKDRDRMLELAKGLRFRPVTWQGAPVMAAGRLCFPRSMVRVEDWLPNPPAFPGIKQWDDVEIGMRRARCLGCSIYDVWITGAGTVVFSGHSTALSGKFKTSIPPSKVQELVERFRQARFLAMRDRYDMRFPHQGYTTLWLRIGKLEKTVYSSTYSEELGRPAIFNDLANAIDDTTGTVRWVKGDPGTVPFLVTSGTDLASPAVVALAQEMIRTGNAQVLIGLVDQDLPLDQVVDANGLNFWSDSPIGNLPLGQALLMMSLRDNLPDLFSRMQAKGWVKRTPPPFLQRFRLTNPDIIRALDAAGIEQPYWPPEQVVSSPEKCSIMSWPSASQVSGAEETQLLECTQELLRRGVKLDRPEMDGYRYVDHAALSSLKVARYLLSNGPQPRLPPDDNGYHNLDIGHDATILTLLEAGIDPRGRDGTASALRKAATKKPLPATLEWLDAHGIH
ncbi:hypothetical protein IP70_04930 [alpha proteobacterium AAP38]|nr:hypothetical protein IP70_04930 [alpha proteobacterium AAP38]